MATPLYNDRGQQIGYLDNNNQFHPIQRDGNANRVYKPQGGTYYNKNGSVNVTASEMNKPKSSAGMPTNVQAGTAANSNAQKVAQTTTNTTPNNTQWSSGDKHYNEAVTAKEAMPKTTVTNTATAKPAVTNTSTAKPAVTNTSTAKPAVTNTATAKPAVTNTATAKPAVTNTATANTATANTATANTAAVDTAATQPVINDFDLNLYDKYAADRIKKKFNKIGKADQYQPFINDFYGSDTMNDNRYNELMNKYELGNTFKNDFDLGKANYMETYDIARRNKVNTENKAKKQEEKQAKADANEEQRVKSQVADMLKKATPYELTQFMVGQGPIYETIAKYSKYFG